MVKSVTRFQKARTSITFRSFRSLYYSEDLEKPPIGSILYTDKDRNDVRDAEFSVGPSIGRETIDNKRASINFDRGPYRSSPAFFFNSSCTDRPLIGHSLRDYLTTIGLQEATYVTELLHFPKSPITLCGPGTHLPTKEQKLRALQCYQELVRYLLPKDKSISSPHLWHSDLRIANIFIDPNQPTNIDGLID